MKVKAFDINLELFGAEFANMDSADQAKFFTGLAKELSMWKSKHQIGLQFACVKDSIDPKLTDYLDKSLGMLIYKGD